jgi:phosphoenolpyruvate synthase/pyruvate phosphate dikinase
LYKDLKDIIKEKRDDLVDENQVASLATKIIEDIMVNPDVRPEIRLKAAQDVLHRTGHDKPKEVNLNQTVSDLSDAELDEQLSELIESSTNVKQLKQG